MIKIKITGNFKIEGLDIVERIEQPLEYLEFELNPLAYGIKLIDARSKEKSRLNSEMMRRTLEKNSIVVMLYLKEFPNSSYGMLTNAKLLEIADLDDTLSNLVNDKFVERVAWKYSLTDYGKNFIEIMLVVMRERKLINKKNKSI